jgi:hypothetical protein
MILIIFSTQFLVLAIGAIAVIAGSWHLRRRERRRLLARIRADWGRPIERDRDLAAIASYHRAVAAPDGSMDQRTWSDLDLDAVFAVLDRTQSSMGQQLLYHRLRSVSGPASLEAFESLMVRLTHDIALRERCQLALAPLASASGYAVWQLAEPGSLDVARWQALYPVLGVSMIAMVILSVFWPQLLIAVIAMAPILLAVRIVTAKRLGRVIAPFRLIGPLIAAAITLRAVNDASNEPLTGPLAEDVPALTRLRVLSGWLTRDAMQMDPITGAIVEMANLLLLIDANALLLGALALRSGGPALRRTLAAVGAIDAAIAIASYRAGAAAWTRPTFHPGGSTIALADLRHPLLPDAVPNSIELARPCGVLITGSNMSGKSTFLRSAGVAMVLAQTINTCSAGRFEGPALAVRSCIGRGDDLVAGKSYYLDEVQAVIALVRAGESGVPHLFLFDELFRGTNAVERVAGSEATLVELMQSATAHVIVAATHDIELVSLLNGLYTTYHFADHVGAEGLVFDYRLTAGPATTRNAITLLELNGAPPGMVTRARARSEGLERARKT